MIMHGKLFRSYWGFGPGFHFLLISCFLLYFFTRKLEPNQVSLNVDGINDACSKNEDINFMFKGFGLSGKVVTHGDNKLNGPSGIKLNLILDKQIIDTTESGPDGRCFFFFLKIYLNKINIFIY